MILVFYQDTSILPASRKATKKQAYNAGLLISGTITFEVSIYGTQNQVSVPTISITQQSVVA